MESRDDVKVTTFDTVPLYSPSLTSSNIAYMSAWVLSGVCGAPEARAASCRAAYSSRRALYKGAKGMLAGF